MSIREKSNIAVLGALSCALLVTGCTSARFAGPSLVTNSVNTASNANLSQQMPGAVAATKLPSAGRYLSASNSRSPYIPAAAVGESNVSSRIQSRNPNVPGMNTRVQAASNIGQSVAAQPSVMRQQLPILTQQPVTSTQSMPSMPSLAEVDLTKAPKIDNSFTTASILESAGIATSPRAVSDNVFIHRIESGESLYSVARRYEVTTDAIVAANGLASPDRIIVGQDVIIPGRPGMTALKTVVAKSSPAKSVVPVDLAKVAEAKLPPAAITAKSEPTQSSQTTSSLLVPTRNVV
ncbi:LysM peptidoglycan-binding domain-containing protein, partial [Maritalea sp.]|uniref:LysM peptidoglycan-binding domain-containing protein n=1 Tax=Maritalea sp. TaxID=2003361 RepID=UPI003EF4218A